MRISVCMYTYACVHRRTYIHIYNLSLYTHIYAPPASILQRRDSRNCLIYAFNGKNGVLRRENNANRQSKLHFQAVCPGVEAQPEGEEKDICSPSKVVSVRTSKARCGKGRGETTRFQSFAGETGTSLRGKGDYLGSPPPFQPPSFPLLPRGLPVLFGIPGPTAWADVSLQTFFYWAVSQWGRARESPRSCWARVGGVRVLTPACKHTLHPPLRRDIVRFFFAFVFRFFFFFFFVSGPHPPRRLVRLRYNLLKERTSFNLGSLVSFTREWNEAGKKNAVFEFVFFSPFR